MRSKFTLKPVVSEKSYALANAQNKYSFWIEGKASKIDVKNDVEKRYKVKVVSVNVVTQPGKVKRDWSTYKKFRKPDQRKAIVALKKGDKIDEFIQV